MNDLPRQKLCELIAKYGESLCDEPLRLEGLLRDLCPKDRGAVNLLVNAIREGVANELRNHSVSVPIELTLARLTKRLRDHQVVTEEGARWAVESWALALGKISAAQLTKPKQPAAAKPTPAPQRPPATGDRSLRAARRAPAVRSYQQPEGEAPYRRKDYDTIPPQRPPERKSRGPLIGFGVIALVAAAAFAGWWFEVRRQQPASQTIGAPPPPTVAQASAPSTVAPVPTAIATATAIQVTGNPFDATKEHPWVNSFGMKFVPVPGTDVLFSIWDTRVRDYQDFANATKREWPEPNFDQGPTHPAVNVSWDDAKAFCEWLTEKERKEGRLKSDQQYRLPTDAEWSAAVGLSKEEGNTPAAKGSNGATKKSYPCGDQWPPPKGAGNYNSSLNVDEYPYTSPVGSFEPNKFGLYDMGGNVWQWCKDWCYENHDYDYHVLRGASWDFSDPGSLLSSDRICSTPALRDFSFGFRCVLAGGSSR